MQAWHVIGHVVRLDKNPLFWDWDVAHGSKSDDTLLFEIQMTTNVLRHLSETLSMLSVSEMSIELTLDDTMRLPGMCY